MHQMKGLKMNFKRILACLLTATTFSVTANAFAPYLPEKDTAAPKKEDSTTQAPQGVVTNFKAGNYHYEMFEQILDAYVEKHLYDFTEEEVLHKFFEDFLKDNPMYFSYFIDYLLGTMDPYSSYYPATSNFLEPDKGSSGFGFMISDSENGIFIESIIAGSNAEELGFEPGDRFVSVAGVNVENHSFDLVRTILAKPENYAAQEETDGTETASKQKAIEIVVDRNGETLTFNISRGPMTISQISHEIVDNNGKPTAIIQISSFLGENTDKAFVELVKTLNADGIKYLTIDLRDNGGGSLDYALSMAETFIENGETICYYKDKSLEEPQAVKSSTDKLSFDSITILINENTASAAELFTSILRDKGLVKVIGTKSFGKSLGQEAYTLPTGDHITITTYQMLSESFESYDGIGLYPDLTIEDVEMCYTLPSLGVFNHQNFVNIKEGEYSDEAKALEDRLALMGLLREKYCDGIVDEMTKTALFVFQKEHNLEATGYINYETVSRITKTINSYKAYTYDDDTQMDVALIVHHSFSQGKRLVNEKERLRIEQKELIEERDARLEVEFGIQ